MEEQEESMRAMRRCGKAARNDKGDKDEDMIRKSKVMTDKEDKDKIEKSNTR